MKKYLLIYIFIAIVCNAFSSVSQSSLPFSNSYLQRSSGVEALYWNPANINNKVRNNEIVVSPFSFALENNAFTLSLYNKATGSYLTDAWKNEFLGEMDKRLSLGMQVSFFTLGYSHKNWAISTSTKATTNTKIDRQYLDLIFFGNSQEKLKTGEAYIFDHSNNDFGLLAYQDFTIGYGGYYINALLPDAWENIPDIYVGASMSYLLGLLTADMTHFHGVFVASEKSVNLDQEAVIRTASMGNGFKMSLGVSSNVYRNDAGHVVDLGISFDNILGNIKWNKNLSESHYFAVVDSVIFDDLKNDVFSDSTYTNKFIGSFDTKLPFVFRVGSKYTYKQYSLSLDYAKNSSANRAFYSDHEISMGIEYCPVVWLPLRFGYRAPIGDIQSLVSLGCGIRTQNFEYGLGIQSPGSFFTTDTKGMGVAMQMKFRY
jgi:hypothetical protein